MNRLVPEQNGEARPHPVPQGERAQGHGGHPMSQAPITRIKPWWEKAVHNAVHPISAIMVLAAAGVEVWEWFAHLAEQLAHVFDGGGHP